MHSSPNLRFHPFLGLLRREVRRFMKVIFQTLATPLITTALYLLIFGVSIGREIQDVKGTPYLAFIVPGLMMMSTVRNAFENASGSIITSKFCGELEDLRMVPLSAPQIAWAHGLGSMFRGLLVGCVTFCIGWLFYYFSHGEFLPLAHPFLLLAFLFLSGVAFGNFGLAVAMRAKNIEEVSAFSTFILLPIIYLGGVFFSLEHLHPFWQGLSSFNPILYLVNGVRYSVLGHSDVDVSLSLLVTFITFLLFHAFALRSLIKGSYHRW